LIVVAKAAKVIFILKIVVRCYIIDRVIPPTATGVPIVIIRITIAYQVRQIKIKINVERSII